ncbi:MAG: DNA-binding protein WhiA [Firmicutes bacterium]|nr:DNA-binding protein WhiA [Bacillota bacterium]
MSFSLVTKNELARVTARKHCCRIAELAALVKMDGSLQISGRKISLHLLNHNAAVARKLFKLLKELYGVQAEVLVKKKMRLHKNNVYLVRVPTQQGLEEMLVGLGMLDEEGLIAEGVFRDLLRSQCCRRAYLRGVFLGGGSVNNPGGTYHLEVITGNERQAADICRLMEGFGLEARISNRKKWLVVYLKESDQIVKCLNLMGAHSALLEFENARVVKDMRNRVNRLVNCETANLNKTVNASLRQTENILFIARNLGMDKLPQSLREVAELRLSFPDASLKELGEMAAPPLGRSGVNHRLRKLDKIAEELDARSTPRAE